VLTAGLLLAAGPALPSGPAHAAWSASSTGTASAGALVVPAMGPVTATRTGLGGLLSRTTATWAAVTVPYGDGGTRLPVTGYYVERFTGSSTTPDVAPSACNRVTVTTTSCTESLSLAQVTTHRYRVHPVFGPWTGPAATSNSM
jgi:hypothetical protein